MADDKKPKAGVTAGASDPAVADAGNDIKKMGFQEFAQRIKAGEIQPPEFKVPGFDELITPERVDKFIMGEITWGELQGMTLDEAYAIAEYGYALYQEGRFHDARTIFEGLIVANPYDAYFHNVCGAVYQQLDMKEEALWEYNASIELDPDNLHAYVNRAEMALQDGHFDQALVDLDKAASLDTTGKDPAGQRAKALAAATRAAMVEIKKIIGSTAKK